MFLRWIPSSSLLLTIIIIIGIVFRFMQLGEVRHGYDEGYPAYDALRILDGGQLMLVGQPSSVFLDNPPFMAYLQTIPLYFWRSLWSVYIFIIALNTMAIWFVFQVTRKLLGDTGALTAAFLFATSPWVVHFSRMPWVQGLLPLFTAIIAWGFWPHIVIKKGAPRNVFIAMMALTAMTQSYILGFAILLPVTILSLIFFRQIPKRPFYSGAIIFVICLTLFGVGLYKNEERNTTKLQSFLSDNAFSVNTQAMEHAIRLVTGLDYEAQAPIEGETFPRQALSRCAHILLSLGLLSGSIQALSALRRDNKERRLAIVLLVWFITPIISFLFLPYLVHPHYLLLSLPAGHVLVAWGTLPLFQQRRWRIAVMLSSLAIACLFWLNLYHAGQVVANSPSGFNGWALGDIAKIGKGIRELAQRSSYPRRVVAKDNSPLLSSISATYVDSMSELVIPDFMLLDQEPLLYILINQTSESLFLGLNQERFSEHTIQLADGTFVSFLGMPSYDRDEALMLPQEIVDWTSNAGLTFLGYSLGTPPPYRKDQSLVVSTFWRVEELRSDRVEWLVSPFIQVLNAKWQIITNESSNGQWGYRWHLGDVYVHRTTILLPEFVKPGEHQLVIGLGDAMHGTGFSLNSPSGARPFYLMPFQIDE